MINVLHGERFALPWALCQCGIKMTSKMAAKIKKKCLFFVVVFFVVFFFFTNVSLFFVFVFFVLIFLHCYNFIDDE